MFHFFFFLQERWYIRSTNLQKDPTQSKKLQRSPLDPGDKDETAAVADAPMLKLPKPWIV
jgi:hypothetical protein